MAQQQDPYTDARAPVGERGVAAGSQDTYRPKGFESPQLSTTGNSGLAAATTTPAAAAPQNISWGRYTGPSTPGIQAAMGAGGSGQPGTPNADRPFLESAGKMALLGPAGLFWNTKPNNSQIQDIGGALYQGLPITDQNWANAGFGPGGVPLSPQPTGLASSSLTGAIGNIAGNIVGQPAGASLAQSAATRYQFANPSLFGGGGAP